MTSNNEQAVPFSYDSYTYQNSYDVDPNQPQTEQSYDFNGVQIIQTPNGGGACFCGKLFSTYNYCRVHFIQVHGEDTTEKTLICLICQHPFAYGLNLKNHLKKEHSINSKLSLVEGNDGQLASTESGEGVCLVCSKKFSTLNYCKVHYRTKHANTETNNQPSYTSSVVQPIPNSNQSILPHTETNAVQCNSPTMAQQQPVDFITNHDNQIMPNQIHHTQYNGNLQSNVDHNLSQQHIDNSSYSQMTSKNSLKRSYPKSSFDTRIENTNLDQSSQRVKQSRSEGGMPISKTPSGGGYCQICGKTYSRIDTARSHFVQVHGEEEEEKEFFCLLCNKGFVFELNLGNHVKQSHGIVGKLQLCEGFGGMLAKTENGGGVCLICGAKYSRMDTLKSHFKAKHEDLQDCNVASIQTSEQALSNSNHCISNQFQNVDTFTRDASPEKKSCTLSDLALAIKEEKQKEIQSLNSHNDSNCTAMHNDFSNVDKVPLIRPVNINTLTMTPSSSSGSIKKQNILSNSDTETSDKKDKLRISTTESGGGICLVCNTSFSIYGNCKAHYIKKHGEDTEGRDHVCLVCQKGFNFLQNLKEHLKSSHGINGIPTRSQEFGDGFYLAKIGNEGGVCLKCCQVFTLFGNLKAHYSKKHGNSKAELNGSTIANTKLIAQQETQMYSPSSNTIGLLPLPKSLAKTSNSGNFKVCLPPVISNKQPIKSEPNHHSKPMSTNEPEVQIAKTESGGGICLICNQSFSQYGNCKVHFIKKHGEDGTGDLHCLMCQARFKFNSNFKEHMVGKHGLAVNLQPCDDGSKMAKDEKGGGACLICCKYFSQFGNLKVHFNKKHSNILSN